MKNRSEISSSSDAIASFLRALPEQVKIEGHINTNRLFINGKMVNLQKSLKVDNHSPTGFNWGYGGSGPCQTALAILLEFVSKEQAQAFKQDFKFGWVAGLPQGKDFSEEINLREVMANILFK